jgi:hypothetical protein
MHTMKLECICSRHANSECLVHMDVHLCICTFLDMHMACLWTYNSCYYAIMMLWQLSMTNDGLCIQENDIAWLKMWMLLLLLLMNSIYVKTHEGGRNGNQKDGRGSL